MKLGERKIITDAHRFNLLASVWLSPHSEVKGEAWMKEALIEVLSRR